MRTFASEQRRIRAVAKRWKDTIALGAWKIDFTYHDGPYVIDGAMNSEAVGSCLARWQYQTAHLEFNTQETAALEDAALEEYVVHELVHALVNEMRPMNGAPPYEAKRPNVCCGVAMVRR